jgi:phenylpyruvate tautomerase PptA (4-oxalocrotonate tautomerase family)
MPMIDAVIPEGALAPEVETRLLNEITDILIRAEGFDPANPVARRLSFLFLQRPAAIFVGGIPATAPRYRITTSVPEGKYTDEAVKTLVREITEAFARAEDRPFADVAPRVWIFPTEIPEGRWGGNGVVNTIGGIQALINGEAERAVGEAQLARRRRTKAVELIEGLADAARRGAA